MMFNKEYMNEPLHLMDLIFIAPNVTNFCFKCEIFQDDLRGSKLARDVREAGN